MFLLLELVWIFFLYETCILSLFTKYLYEEQSITKKPFKNKKVKIWIIEFLKVLHQSLEVYERSGH